MAKAKPCIMTLFTTSSLDQPDSIISYILNYYVQIPSRITRNYQDLEISLRKDIAISGGNNVRLKDLIIDSLTSVITRYFQNYDLLQIDVDFLPIDPTKPNDDDQQISISIDCMINGQSITLSMLRKLSDYK